MFKRIAILGSTGSIGRQTLEVINEFSGQFEVYALAAGSNYELLAKQTALFKPKYIAIGEKSLYPEIKAKITDRDVKILAGMEGLSALATLPEVDLVLTAVVGSMGIKPTLDAIMAGKQIALANKETLVAAGSIIMEAATGRGIEIMPVDSEHSALFQCLEGRKPSQISRLILTASGGPFRNYQPEELENVTLDQALNHPKWKMGGKISIDSATMFNKGLEVIEAHWLFGMPYERISVVIHPESIVHSMVELVDGSNIAQLGLCDMRLPIQLALTYPERFQSGFPKLDPAQGMQLNFSPVNPELFPALTLAFEAGKKGGSLPAAMNAANEEAVKAFQEGKIKFAEIVRIVSNVMGNHQNEGFSSNPGLDEIFKVDHWARTVTGNLIKGRANLGSF